MISKEKFVKAIALIKEHRDRETKFLAGLDAVSPDTNNDTFIYSDYEGFLVDLLVEAMNDKNEIIPWFIYDAEFGTVDEQFCTITIDDIDILLDTAEKVYNFLTK